MRASVRSASLVIPGTNSAELSTNSNRPICVIFRPPPTVIFAEAVVDAKPLLFQHLEGSLRRFADATDGVDVLLQAEFGGFTAAGGPVASVQLH
jgi:hypothetical protein